MTLTSALRQALDPATHASNLTPLRQIAAQDEPDEWLTARQSLLAHLFLAGLDRAHLNGRIASAASAIVFTLLAGGADREDLRLVTMEPAVAPEMPRSAEWVDAALRLAAWADGEVSKVTRDPLLPVRLVDGVWITEEPQTAETKHRQEHLVAELMSAEAVELGRSLNRDLCPPPDDAPPSAGARNFPCDPYPPPPWAKVASITTDQVTDATERQPGIMAPTARMPWGYGDGDRNLRQWATPGVVEIAGQTFVAKVTLPERPKTTETTITLDAEATSDGEHTIPVTMTLTYETMRCVALVALDGSGVHGIGADLAAAQAHALSTRDDDDPAWLDTLRAVTLSGEPAAVQAFVDSLSSLPAGGDVWEGT